MRSVKIGAENPRHNPYTKNYPAQFVTSFDLEWDGEVTHHDCYIDLDGGQPGVCWHPCLHWRNSVANVDLTDYKWDYAHEQNSKLGILHRAAKAVVEERWWLFFQKKPFIEFGDRYRVHEDFKRFV